MVVFADTSALLKLALDELYTPDVQSLIGADDTSPAVCRIAWVEAISGLSRRARFRTADLADIANAKMALAQIWRRFSVVEVTPGVVERAANHAETYALRAYDAVQLAAAHELALAAAQPVTFACFDKALNAAAKAIGLRVPFAAA